MSVATEKTTQELFDEYIKYLKALDEYSGEFGEKKIAKIKYDMYRPEVDEFEEKTGKRFIRMNSDEAIEFITNLRSEKVAKYSVTTIMYYVSRFRNFWDWYIENYEYIRNPFDDRRLTAANLAKAYADNKDKLSVERLNQIIVDVRRVFHGERGEYTECLILLYYEGFSEASEIALLQEKDINFDTREIRLPGRTIKLSERCFELLLRVNRMEHIATERKIKMVSWRNGFFKYPVRKREEINIDEREPIEIQKLLNKFLTTDLFNQFGYSLRYRDLYLLGFYNFLVNKHGKEKTSELIETMSRNASKSEMARRKKELVDSAREYGLVYTKIDAIKKSLLIFE